MCTSLRSHIQTINYFLPVEPAHPFVDHDSFAEHHILSVLKWGVRFKLARRTQM